MKTIAFILFGMGATVVGIWRAEAWLPETLLGFAGLCSVVGGVIGIALGWFLCSLFAAGRTGRGLPRERSFCDGCGEWEDLSKGALSRTADGAYCPNCLEFQRTLTVAFRNERRRR